MEANPLTSFDRRNKAEDKSLVNFVEFLATNLYDVINVELKEPDVPDPLESKPSLFHESDELKIKRKNPNKDEIRSYWNFERLFISLGTPEQCIDFAVKRGLILGSKICNRHRKPMLIKSSVYYKYGFFRCNKKKCNISISRTKHTIFENSKLPATSFFRLLYCFSQDLTYNQTIRECTTVDNETVMSFKTASKCFDTFREALLSDFTERLTHLQSDAEDISFPDLLKNNFLEEDEETEQENMTVETEAGPSEAENSLPEIKQEPITLENFLNYNEEPDKPQTQLNMKEEKTEEEVEVEIMPNVTPIKKLKESAVQRVDKHWHKLKERFCKRYPFSNFEKWLAEHIWRMHVKKRKLDHFEEMITVISRVYKPR